MPVYTSAGTAEGVDGCTERVLFRLIDSNLLNYSQHLH